LLLVQALDHQFGAQRAAKTRLPASKLYEIAPSDREAWIDAAVPRLDDGRIAVDPVALDLVALVGGVTQRMTGAAPEFQIIVSAEPAVIQMEADARLTEQVFKNLLSNAIKYSGTQRRIEIAASMRNAGRLNAFSRGERPRS